MKLKLGDRIKIEYENNTDFYCLLITAVEHERVQYRASVLSSSFNYESSMEVILMEDTLVHPHIKWKLIEREVDKEYEALFI